MKGVNETIEKIGNTHIKEKLPKHKYFVLYQNFVVNQGRQRPSVLVNMNLSLGQ